MSSPSVMPWGGHPQGAPLPIVFSPRYALGRAPTRGAPTYCLLSALCPGEGTHKGRPYLLSSPGPVIASGEGTHKGRPYLLSSLRVMPWGGHPQGAPLPIVFSPRYALGRAPTSHALVLSQFDAMPWGGHPQGAPLPIVFSRRLCTYCLLSALCPGEGTHKGRPYVFSYPDTRFRQPQVVLSQFDAIALGKHQGIGVSEKHLRSPHSGWLFCLVAN